MPTRPVLPSLLALASALAFACLVGGCETTPHAKPPAPTPAATAAAKPKKRPAPPAGADRYEDVEFQEFVVRLRAAVRAHDLNAVAGMMTRDFGYRLDPPGEGEGVFKYWDENNLWPELELIVNERFAPNQEYMVAPEEFTTNAASYNGYRAGVRRDKGEWKFAYFVAG